MVTHRAWSQDLTGDVDPSADAGVAAPLGTTFRRVYLNGDVPTGELWLKVGGADTEWQQITSA